MYRHTSCFADGIEAIDDLVPTFGVYHDSLTMNVSGQATHHVVTGWNHGNRFFYGVNMREGL